MARTIASVVCRRMDARLHGAAHKLGFIYAHKTRALRRGRRWAVTGVVVDQQLCVDCETLRKFRALLFYPWSHVSPGIEAHRPSPAP